MPNRLIPVKNLRRSRTFQASFKVLANISSPAFRRTGGRSVSVFPARRGSWVTITMVVPSLCRPSRMAMISSPIWLSRFPVGSSASRMRGPPTMARGHRHPLLLPARQLGGEVVQPRPQPHPVERRRRLRRRSLADSAGTAAGSARCRAR
jgi:hypothetical protein